MELINLITKKWVARHSGGIKIYNKDNKLIIDNTAETHKVLICLKLFKKKMQDNVRFVFEGKVINGTACTLKVLSRHKQQLAVMGLNSDSSAVIPAKYFFLVLYVPEHSKIEISKLTYQNVVEDNEEEYLKKLNGEILVLTPGYPTEDNKYNSAFVHTRVREYKKLKWNVDVLMVGNSFPLSFYNFEGVDVLKTNYFHLRNLLQKKQYKRIIVHFFSNDVANVLESVDVSNTNLYFFCHGAETLYYDWPKIASRYFEPPAVIDDNLKKEFEKRDYYIKKYNNFTNVTWCFVSEFAKNRAEELLNIKFNNCEIIPCYINTDLFKYEKKDPEQRKKIFVLRKFDDVNSYSIDTVVRTILELSHRKFFNDLCFDIYGDGSLHEQLLAPVRQFENVHIHKTFLTHEEIKDVHKTHGIALLPTRFDTQGVTNCEAASSGCALISSNVPGVKKYIPEELNVLFDPEDYKAYADCIEKMYNDKDYFLNVAKEESESVRNKYDYKHTIQKELDMYEKEKPAHTLTTKKEKETVLTIIVPSYNVEKFLRGTIISMLDQKNAGYLEILIVNDGSKDNTPIIGKELENLTKQGKETGIVRLINKENGGHGSTINVGIKEAKGKYIKIVDGDDTVDSEEFEKLIEILKTEDSDIVLNNYMEDFATTNETNIRKFYTQLKPGVQYHFDDICYENYGFGHWGPILSCSSYKTSVIKDKFELLEKMFYVDMLLNINIAILCDTITYYDLVVYRYYQGRVGQSISAASFKKNYKHHEAVTLKMAEIYYKNKDNISKSRREYIINKLLYRMINTQYFVIFYYVRTIKAFTSFDNKLKKYPELYNGLYVTKGLKIHRKLKGLIVPLNKYIIRLKNIIKP